MALTMRILSAMSPLLIRYRNTGCVHAFAEDEFETSHYLKLPEYHVTAKYLRSAAMYTGYTTETHSEAGKKKLQVRGRALLVQTGPNVSGLIPIRGCPQNKALFPRGFD